MQLPANLLKILNPKIDPNLPPEKIKKQKIFRLLTIGSLILLFFLLLFSVSLLLSPSSQEIKKPTPKTDPEKALEKTKQEKEEASRSAEEAAKPLNRIKTAYNEIIGSDSLKKRLTLDEGGVATIDYIISSTDGIFIIKTSYENFAELAIRIFNIPEVTKLSVSSYATKFIDQYGQPNQVAVVLEVNRETNSKINWAVKKYSYKDYAKILNRHEINQLLNKDYQKILKEN